MVMQRPAKPCTTVRFRIPASIFLPGRIAPGAPAQSRAIAPLSFFHAPVMGLRHEGGGLCRTRPDRYAATVPDTRLSPMD
ncbi:hypothetical protein CBM2606_A20093 [Cupriavidus taiwanensis]|nr:hypothetical protein CBM2606_A20093 [Cupriavidus taiwanensis]